MKKEYIKILRKLKKEMKGMEDNPAKEKYILAIDTYIKTFKSDEITEEDVIKYLKGVLNESTNN